MLTELQREMIKPITDNSTCKNNLKYIYMYVLYVANTMYL